MLIKTWFSIIFLIKAWNQLTKFLKIWHEKNETISLTPTQIKAFDAVKHKLPKASLFVYSVLNVKFSLVIDALDIEISAVLQQFHQEHLQPLVVQAGKILTKRDCMHTL